MIFEISGLFCCVFWPVYPLLSGQFRWVVLDDFFVIESTEFSASVACLHSLRFCLLHQQEMHMLPIKLDRCTGLLCGGIAFTQLFLAASYPSFVCTQSNLKFILPVS